MSRIVELPDSVYDALERVATARGLTPAAWIAAHLPLAPQENPPAKSMADLLTGLVGVVAGEPGNWSEDAGRKFTDGLVEKRQAGHL